MVKGFEIGCDDYISKPFSVEVLKHKINAMIRMQKGVSHNVFEYEGLKIDFEKIEVTLNDEDVNLTATEYKILELLAKNKGKVMTKEMILDKIWDCKGNYVDDNTLSVNIRRLRKKIERDPKNCKYIITVFGIGYVITGKIASWYIGINTQPWINFYVDADTFKFTVDQPTCSTIALDSTSQNISGNKINLGDYYVSQVKQEITQVVPFTIRGDYCYASKITVKLKATTEAPNKKLIGKSSGSATGVGVKVYSTANNSEVQLNADNSNEIIFNYANWSNNLLYFPFTAQLVKDGSNGTISPGDFTGNATFSFSYE